MRLSLVLFPSLIAGLHAAIQPLNSLGTVLENKCNFLKTKTRSAFVGNSCFACTVQRFRTNLTEWHKLHNHCEDLQGYKGRMAFIRTTEQIQKLTQAQVIEDKGRYFIGAKQDPPSDCGGQLCRRDKHIVNWYYIDEKGEKQGELNKNLWLRGEPNNAGDSPPENVVTLEAFDAQKLGFNDGNGEHQNFPILCEYVNSIQCKEGWFLIDNRCIKVVEGPITPSKAERQCQKEGGELASIHNDKRNTHIARYARSILEGKEIKATKEGVNYGAVLFGMTFSKREWMNVDGTDVDYFRWFVLQGKQHPNIKYPPTKYNWVGLSTKTNTDDNVPAFAYWLNIYRDDDEVYAYVCESSTLTVNFN